MQFAREAIYEASKVSKQVSASPPYFALADTIVCDLLSLFYLVWVMIHPHRMSTPIFGSEGVGAVLVYVFDICTIEPFPARQWSCGEV